MSERRNSQRDFILKWNIDFPLDRWWRKRHGVAFNSKEHRSASFIDMKLEYEEDLLFIPQEKKSVRNKEEDKLFYLETGNWLKSGIEVNLEDVSEEESQEIYDNIDLDQLNANIKIED